jgi:hypothetical protein
VSLKAMYLIGVGLRWCLVAAGAVWFPVITALALAVILSANSDYDDYMKKFEGAE